MNATYGIRSDYKARDKYSYFDDTVFQDEWQKEVYTSAKELMLQEGHQTVCDFGCGSAYKLLKYLGDFITTGIDVPETVSFLRERYPSHRWLNSTTDLKEEKFDLVICSDVVEHVLNPDELMRAVTSLARKRIILSTPDRALCYPKGSPHLLGPPKNPTHVREWTFQEFAEYASRFVDIEEHFISNRTQATQMIVGRPLSGTPLGLYETISTKLSILRRSLIYRLG